MSSTHRVSLRRRIFDFCRVRLPSLLAPREAERFQAYLDGLIGAKARPRSKGQEFDWPAIAAAAEIDLGALEAVKGHLRPALLAVDQAFVGLKPRQPKTAASKAKASAPKPKKSGKRNRTQARRLSRMRHPNELIRIETAQPFTDVWDDPETFCEALGLHMRRHGDTSADLAKALATAGELIDRSAILAWRRGVKAPRSVVSLRILNQIEARYGLPKGYFKAKLPHPSRSAIGHDMPGIRQSERRRIAWHLPDDFDQRPAAEREEILEWVRRVVVSGSTEYRRYQAAAMKVRFGLRFPGFGRIAPTSVEDVDDVPVDDPYAPHQLTGSMAAPPQLAAEMAALLDFKTSTLTALGYQRSGVWGDQTAAQKVEHLSLLFGALTASPHGPVRGYGLPRQRLSFALLAIPAVWDWYIQWRERRRGFYTAWEIDMLSVGAALTRKDTGWLRQTPSLAMRLGPIAGLISQADVDQAQLDWSATCDLAYTHTLARAKEIGRVARVHRDPFEPILPVLEAPSPVGEYRKITEEIVRLMPDQRRYPRAAAETVRAFLMLRLGLHLGLRQKNLRQLLLCPRGGASLGERRLTELKRGEIRWSDRDEGWEVFIPAVAFKNAGSSFFGSKPYRLVLPDLGDLYLYLEAYIDRHRSVLLRGAKDPGTFFVKTVKVTSQDAAYDQNTFYEAWRWAIQRYGIYNPYTGRGAINGLLPHGPHNVRDVLATHILKQTGSYEQASYAIQDTPDMVAKHYGRFLPQDKAALAAQILNRVWEAA